MGAESQDFGSSRQGEVWVDGEGQGTSARLQAAGSPWPGSLVKRPRQDKGMAPVGLLLCLGLRVRPGEPEEGANTDLTTEVIPQVARAPRPGSCFVPRVPSSASCSCQSELFSQLLEPLGRGGGRRHCLR